MCKFEATKYILLQLCDWYYEMNPSKKEDYRNDFSILKILKLVFLLAPIKIGDETLLDKGFSFQAWTYGPVEPDLYFYKNKLALSENGKKVVYEDLLLSKTSELLTDRDRLFLSSIVQELKAKNKKIIDYTAMELVSLTHLYSSWISNYDGTFNRSIPSKDILEEEKFYFLLDI